MLRDGQRWVVHGPTPGSEAHSNDPSTVPSTSPGTANDAADQGPGHRHRPGPCSVRRGASTHHPPIATGRAILQRCPTRGKPPSTAAGCGWGPVSCFPSLSPPPLVSPSVCPSLPSLRFSPLLRPGYLPGPAQGTEGGTDPQSPALPSHPTPGC